MIEKGYPALIADDDQYFRLALAGLLKGTLGFSNVIETGSLDEALQRLSESAGRISLALFDLSMPGMNGPATLGAVRECHPKLCLSVVSASQSRRDVLMALEMGVHGFIPKLFAPDELVRALKVIIAGDIFVPAFVAQVCADQKVPGVNDVKKCPSSTGDWKGAKPLISITPRQREVLHFLAQGLSNKQIAYQLSLGEGTVKIHVAALLRNLGVANRAAAAAASTTLLRA